MTGTLINAGGIIVGGILGLIFKRGIKQSMMDMLIKVEGIAIFLIGITGALTFLISIGEDGKLSSSGELLLLCSLVIGTVIGEFFGIDDLFNKFGLKIEKKIGKDGFAKGFINASIIFCTGSMAIIGSINDGISGDINILLVKTILDLVTALVLATTMGFGVCFSSVSVLVYQGIITLSASAISGLIVSRSIMMDQVYMVGFAIIMCIGTNFVFDTKIRTANLIPSLLVPIVYNLIFV